MIEIFSLRMGETQLLILGITFRLYQIRQATYCLANFVSCSRTKDNFDIRKRSYIDEGGDAKTNKFSE